MLQIPGYNLNHIDAAARTFVLDLFWRLYTRVVWRHDWRHDQKVKKGQTVTN